MRFLLFLFLNCFSAVSLLAQNCVTEFHNLNDHQPLPGWEYLPNGSFFDDGKLWAMPVNHGGGFRHVFDGTYATSIHYEMDALARYSYWGATVSAQVQLIDGSEIRFKHGVERAHQGNNNYVGIDLPGNNGAYVMRYPREDGEFQFTATLEDENALLIAKRVSDQEIVTVLDQSLPGFFLANIAYVRFQVSSHTDNGIWLDNPFFTACYDYPNSNPVVVGPKFKQVREGEQMMALFDVTDPDGDEVSLQATGLPSGAQLIEEPYNTYTLTWTPFWNAGNTLYPITLIADDGMGGTTSHVLEVQVENYPPLEQQGDLLSCLNAFPDSVFAERMPHQRNNRRYFENHLHIVGNHLAAERWAQAIQALIHLQTKCDNGLIDTARNDKILPGAYQEELFKKLSDLAANIQVTHIDLKRDFSIR